MSFVKTEHELSALLLGLTSANADVRALTERLADAMCDDVLEGEDVEACVLAEAAVRAAAILCAVSARRGGASTMLRLGSMLWLRLADEIDARNGHRAAASAMPGALQ